MINTSYTIIKNPFTLLRKIPHPALSFLQGESALKVFDGSAHS